MEEKDQIEVQKAIQLSEEELSQVNGGSAPSLPSKNIKDYSPESSIDFFEGPQS